MRRNHVNIAAIYVPEQTFHEQFERRRAKSDVANCENITRHRGFTSEKTAEYENLFANPYQAASYGYIDDVIEPRNTRFRVIRAFQALQTKKVTNPLKKHSNIPL